MTLKFINSGDGNQTYDLQRLPYQSGSISYVAAPSGWTGTWMQFSGGGAGRMWVGLSYANDTLIMGFRAELPASNPSTTGPLARFGWHDGATLISHVYIEFTPTGVLRARLDDNTGTIIGTGTTPLPWGSGPRYFEFKVKVHNSAGTIEVRLDETTVLLNLSGVDTQNAGSAICNTASPLSWTNGNGHTQWKYRDLYVCGNDGSVNNDFMGVQKTGVKRVTGAGASAQFTPSAGSNFQNVDDGVTADDDTTYNKSNTVGHIDTFALGSSGLVSTAVIRGTQTAIIMRKDDVDARQGSVVIRSGGTNFPQATITPGPSFQMSMQVQETDPATGVGWTQAGLDAAELGYKMIA